jgi:TIR domain
MTAVEKPSVFISHSARDADWARRFAQAPKQRGVTVCIDDLDVRPGESLRDALESGLRGSDMLVALVDPKYQASQTCSSNSGFVSIVPRDLDPNSLPLNVRLRRYLIQDSPEQTAEELSNALLAA